MESYICTRGINITSKMSSRQRPLHACGVSMIKTAQKASAAAKDLGGTLGSIAKRVAKLTSFATPFVQALLYLWLVLLSAADDHILAAEGIIEKIFPPSKHVFNKIDELVRVVENLPAKFDYAVKRFPTIIHQVPFLDWALGHVISLLELLITRLTYWGSGGTREKEITVDINCNNGESKSKLDQPTKSPLHVKNGNTEGEFLPVSETQRAETDTPSVDVKRDGTKSTYKEILEKGKNDKRTDQIANQEETRGKVAEGKDESSKDDTIMKLFELGWLTKRGRERN